MARALSAIASRRHFSSYSTHKFSLAKLSSRNQAPSASAAAAAATKSGFIDHHETTPSTPSSLPATAAAASAARKTATTVWWGPDANTGMWAPDSGAESSEVRYNDPMNASVLHHQEQAWFREDVHL